MRIAVKEVGKPLQIIETSEQYRMDCVKEFIPDFKQFVWLNSDNTLSLGVDESGLMKKLPVNFLLSMSNAYFPIQKMVGTVVFVRTKPLDTTGTIYDLSEEEILDALLNGKPLPELKEIEDYEVDDLSEADLQFIHNILSEEYQKVLKEKFVDYGRGSFIIEKL